MQPANGASGVRPDASVNVTARNGRIVSATLVDDAGQPVGGTLAPDGSAWSTGGVGLAPATHYRVDLKIDTPRGPKTRTVAFSTLTPTATVSATVSPGDNEVVGVGQPIIVKFSDPVSDRAAVERRLAVHTSVPIVGAWHWFSDSEVHFRPQDYWPAHAQVDVAANLAGVEAGDGVWGDQNITTKFAIGDAHVSTVDVDSHEMTVTVNGQTVRTIPSSTGRSDLPTMGGTLITLDKAQSVVMDSSTNGVPVDSPDGYRETVYWNVRLTNSGIYVHAAPWSVGSQGRANVSHGCVNVSDDAAQWFYGFSQPGDVVKVVGSPRAPSSTDAGITRLEHELGRLGRRAARHPVSRSAERAPDRRRESGGHAVDARPPVSAPLVRLATTRAQVFRARRLSRCSLARRACAPRASVLRSSSPPACARPSSSPRSFGTLPGERGLLEVLERRDPCNALGLDADRLAGRGVAAHPRGDGPHERTSRIP